jgi:uncharacterized membrane protein SpoIIM required for sporulation
VVIGLLFSGLIGHVYATRYPLPPGLVSLEGVSVEMFSDLPAVDWLPTFTIWGVLGNNIRALLLAALMAIFSFGTLAVALLMAPLAIVFFFVTQVAQMGYSPALFFATFVLPHGLLEVPAASIATALAVRLGATVISPPQGMTVSEGWLLTLADFVKVFAALVVPLLALAAAVEVYLTPLVVVWAFGG